jgi:hypothetical protein
MISKNTRPGTKVLYCPPEGVGLYKTERDSLGRDKTIPVGQHLDPKLEYTVATVIDLKPYYPWVREEMRYAVRLFESNPEMVYTLEMFRYPSLPESLTSILEGKPFDVDLLEEEDV